MSVEVAPPNLPSRLPSLLSWVGSRRNHLPSPDIAPTELPPLSHSYQLLGSGLRTPPVDDMSTTYQSAPVAYNDNHSLHSYSADLAHASRSRATTSTTAQTSILGDSRDSTPCSHHRCLLENHSTLIPDSQSMSSGTSHPQSRLSLASSGQSAKQTTPSSAASFSNTASSSHDAVSSINRAENVVLQSLRVPTRVKVDGLSLTDLAAEMTCLFWFETIDELRKAGSSQPRPSNAPVPRLPALAKPHDQFRKWVSNILTTTQVTPNVVFLALLFIYRLKMSTPQIKGQGGSEYRLLTVALMLGNKFLDDNTYTNRTWAEVSSFAAQEIHVMEVEFLSNLRYNLVASKEEWEDWLAKLGRFNGYYERASNITASPIFASSPPMRGVTSLMASPTTAPPPLSDLLPSSPAGAAVANFSPSSTRFRDWAAQSHPSSPLASKPPTSFPDPRKRTLEEDLTDHPAKRRPPHQIARAHGLTNARPPVMMDSARLPMPHPTIVTNQEPSGAGPYPTTTSAYAPQAVAALPSVVSLPPLQTGITRMPLYPSPAVSAVSQLTVTPAVAPVPAMPVSGHQGATMTTLPAQPPFSYSTPSKRRNPNSLASYVSSPMNEPPHFAPHSGVHNPVSNSPSVYLMSRASPYRPIRHVSTLLCPPPSASLDQYHLVVPVQPAQMHYQPLGRRNDLRTGVVPEFAVYHEGHQRNLNTSDRLSGPSVP